MKNSAKKLIVFCVLVSFQLKAQLVKTEINTVPSAVLKKAKLFVYDFTMYPQPKNLKKFITDHGNAYLLKEYDFKKQVALSKQINNIYGNLVKIDLVEVLKDEQSNYILRHKGYYDKADEISELRVHTNANFKFSGVTFHPWYIKKYKKFGKETSLEKLHIDSLNLKNIEKAYDFADRNFRCNSNNFVKLTNENSIQRLRLSSTKEKLIERCENIYKEYGSLVSFTLHEVLTDGYRNIYRYKAIYDQTDELIEIVVYTNFEHKFMAAGNKGDWNDVYEEVQPKIED